MTCACCGLVNCNELRQDEVPWSSEVWSNCPPEMYYMSFWLSHSSCCWEAILVFCHLFFGTQNWPCVFSVLTALRSFERLCLPTQRLVGRSWRLGCYHAWFRLRCGRQCTFSSSCTGDVWSWCTSCDLELTFQGQKGSALFLGEIPWKNDAKIAIMGMFDSEKEWIRVYFESNKGLVGMSGVPYNPDGSFFLRHAWL